MIKSIELQNFQSHPKSILELSPGVNIIVGSSDSGKTAIIRAIRKLKDNRPLGNAFRSHWGGDTVISMSFEDGVVTRNIGKSDSYLLENNRTLEFKAFGTSVPEEITKYLNISTLNLQSQLESPFLLTSTSGEVAQHFNRIAKIDQIDFSRKKVESKLRSLDQDVKYGKEEVKRLKEELTSFEYLEKFEIDLEVLEEIENKRLKKIQSFQKLTALLKSIEETETSIINNSSLLPAEKQVNDLLKKKEGLDEKIEKHSQLSKHIKNIENTDSKVEEHQALIKDNVLVTKLLKTHENVEKLQSKKEALESLIDDIETVLYKYDEKKKYLTKKEEKFQSEFPNTCPLCGTKNPKL